MVVKELCKVVNTKCSPNGLQQQRQGAIYEHDDKQLSGNYIITHLRHTFTKSKQLKHKIVMQVAKDSGKSNPLPDVGILQSNQLGPERNFAKSVDVSAGYSVDQVYVDGVI